MYFFKKIVSSPQLSYILINGGEDKNWNDDNAILRHLLWLLMIEVHIYWMKCGNCRTGKRKEWMESEWISKNEISGSEAVFILN